MSKDGEEVAPSAQGKEMDYRAYLPQRRFGILDRYFGENSPPLEILVLSPEEREKMRDELMSRNAKNEYEEILKAYFKTHAVEDIAQAKSGSHQDVWAIDGYVVKHLRSPDLFPSRSRGDAITKEEVLEKKRLIDEHVQELREKLGDLVPRVRSLIVQDAKGCQLYTFQKNLLQWRQHAYRDILHLGNDFPLLETLSDNKNETLRNDFIRLYRCMRDFRREGIKFDLTNANNATICHDDTIPGNPLRLKIYDVFPMLAMSSAAQASHPHLFTILESEVRPDRERYYDDINNFWSFIEQWAARDECKKEITRQDREDARAKEARGEDRRDPPLREMT